MILLYNIGLFLLFLIYLPQALYKRLRYGKYQSKFSLPTVPPADKPIIWIHACSAGETKAASTLAPHLKDYTLVISSTTESGHAMAKQLIPAHAHFLLPFDFPWLMAKLAKRISSAALILVESDCWLNLLHFVKCPKFLVSGVLSERSFKRYKLLPSFARAVYSHFLFIGVQNPVYQERFSALGIQTTVTGNLKFDLPVPPSSPEDFAITIGSTHGGEEEAILAELQPLLNAHPTLKLYIVPRHPERFEQVKAQFSTPRTTVITEMGVLQSYYARSKLAIVGGSFVGNIGGHNILEPIFQHIPVIFGPQMHSQAELVELSKGAGQQVELSQLRAAVEKCLTDQGHYQMLCKAASDLHASLSGVAKKTLSMIQPSIQHP